MFWEHTFNAYTLFCKAVSPITSSELLSEHVIFNENVQIGGRVPPYTTWIDKSVYCIAHFLKNNGEFISQIDFNMKYGISVDFLRFQGCAKSIKKYIRSSQIQVAMLKAIYSIPFKMYYDILTKNDSNLNCFRSGETS